MHWPFCVTVGAGRFKLGPVVPEYNVYWVERAVLIGHKIKNIFSAPYNEVQREVRSFQKGGLWRDQRMGMLVAAGGLSVV